MDVEEEGLPLPLISCEVTKCLVELVRRWKNAEAEKFKISYPAALRPSNYFEVEE